MPHLEAINKKDYSYIVTYDDEPNIPPRHMLFENDLDNEKNHTYISQEMLDKCLNDDVWEDNGTYYSDTNRIHFMIKMLKRHRMAIEAGNVLTEMYKNEFNNISDDDEKKKCMENYKIEMVKIINDVSGDTKIELMSIRNNAINYPMRKF
jgi:uncharacterized protein YjcR